jgi:hypothetical protein
VEKNPIFFNLSKGDPMKKRESAKVKKEHEAKAGKMYNESAKHKDAEKKDMKKAMKGCK